MYKKSHLLLSLNVYNLRVQSNPSVFEKTVAIEVD